MIALAALPLAAALANAYAALTDARPFRPAGTESEARKHLTLWAGLEFDPQVVRAFLSLRDMTELRSFARAASAGETASEESVEPSREEVAPLVAQSSLNPWDDAS